MAKIDEKIEQLEARLQKAKALRSAERRKRRTRGLIALGGLVLAAARKDPAKLAQLHQLAQHATERDRDAIREVLSDEQDG